MKNTDSLHELIEQNRESKIARIEAVKLEHDAISDKSNSKNKENNNNQNNNTNNYYFCGATVDSRGHIIGIPSKYSRVLDINPDNDEITQWGDLEVREKKGWCGGCLSSDGMVYGFPRGRDAFLKLDTNNKLTEEILIGIDYNSDHHYGGAINSKGTIYCPPRWHGSVLSYDMNKNIIWEIALPEHLPTNDSFYGAVADFNDNIYFFPRGDLVRVLRCDKNGRLEYIGNTFKEAHFNSGCLGPDGDVYGFGAYKKGILHIDTKSSETEILIQEFKGGCFGAKLAFNGKIYGIPGDADSIVELDPITKNIMSYNSLPNVEKGKKGKCAGGAIDRYGNIWCVPAMGEYIYKVSFDNIKVLPSEKLYRSLYFASVY